MYRSEGGETKCACTYAYVCECVSMCVCEV